MVGVATIFKVIILSLIFAILTYKIIQFFYHIYINSFRPNILFKAKPQYLHPDSSYYYTNYIIHSNLVYDMDTIDGHRLSIIKQIYNSDTDLSNKVSRVRKILSNKEKRNLNHILKQIYVVPIFSMTHLERIKRTSIFKRSLLIKQSNLDQRFKKDTKVYLTDLSTASIKSYIMQYTVASDDILYTNRYYILIDLSSTQIKTSQYVFTQIILGGIMQILYHNTYTSD
jgi:hypothetical protein